MQHYQIHNRVNSFPVNSSYEVEISFTGREPKKESLQIPIDQFFSQSHNLVDGAISTSPLMYDNPNSLGHLSPVEPERSLPADTPVDDIHRMVISKDCQSLSQVQQLKRLRPVETDFLEVDKVEQPVEPPQPSANE